MEKRRYSNIDILRGIGILFMVAGHFWGIPFLKTYLYSFHMPLFFFISGFLFSGLEKGGFRVFLLKKIRTLLFPYVCFGIFIAGLTGLVSGFDSGMVVLKALAWNNVGSDAANAGTFWFITALFFAELFFVLLSFVFRRRNLLFGVCIALSVFAACLPLFYQGRFPFGIDSALVGLGFFAFGVLFRDMQAKLQTIQKPKPALGVAIWVFSFALSFILALLQGKVNMRLAEYPIVPLVFVCALWGILLWWYFAKALDALNEKPFFALVNRGLKFVGQNSLLYLLLSSLIGNVLNELKAFLIPTQLRFPLSYLWLLVLYVLIFAFMFPVILLFTKTNLCIFIGKPPFRKKKQDSIKG